MSFRQFVIGAIALCFTLIAGAETVRFRSGELLSAEISTRSPRMTAIDPVHFPSLPAKKIYAVLVLQLDSGRKISIYDYSIRAFGRTFPCVAVWRSGKFVFHDGSLSERRIGLLFVLDATQFGLHKEERLTLHSVCPPEKLADQDIFFRVLGNGPLKEPDKVPAQGNMAVRP